MKRIFTTLVIICALFGTVSAQNYTKVGNTYKAEKALYEHLKEVMSANRFRLKYSTAEIIYEDEFSLIQVSIRATNLVN